MGNSENAECFMFAECIISGTRQTAALPSVSFKTLGILLYSTYLWFAATIRHSAYLIFTECQHSASMGHSAITNTWPARAPFYRAACRPLVLRRVSVRDTRRSIYLPSVLFRHSAKCMVCRVFMETLGDCKTIFPSSALHNFSTPHIRHLVLHVKSWSISWSVCYI